MTGGSSLEPIDTQALVVRSVSYKETHRIFTLLTTELGKVGVIAYGAKSPKSGLAGALQPFQLLHVTLKPKRSRDLFQLTDADVMEAYKNVPGDPARYAAAAYALELVRELTPEADADAHPVQILVSFLRRLDVDGAGSALLAAVVLSSLAQAGFAPSLDRCAACGRLAPSGRAGHFDYMRGMVCSACGGSGPLVRGRVRAGLLAASEWDDPTTCADADLASAVELLCRFAHEHLGRELKSWSLLNRQLRAWSLAAEKSCADD